MGTPASPRDSAYRFSLKSHPMTGRLLSFAASVGFAILTGLFTSEPAAAEDVAAGSAAFQSACVACHALDGHAKIGPSLNGIVGHKAGAAPGYAYSAALKAYGKPWTAANLDAFIAAPSKTAPGTRMTFYGIKDPAKRADLIAFLKTKK